MNFLSLALIMILALFWIPLLVSSKTYKHKAVNLITAYGAILQWVIKPWLGILYHIFIRKQTPAARNSTYMLYFIYWAKKKKMRHFRLCLHDAHMQNVQKCAASQNATMAHWSQKLSNKTLFLKSTYNTPEISRVSWIVTFYISTIIKNFVIISWNC